MKQVLRVIRYRKGIRMRRKYMSLTILLIKTILNTSLNVVCLLINQDFEHGSFRGRSVVISTRGGALPEHQDKVELFKRYFSYLKCIYLQTFCVYANMQETEYQSTSKTVEFPSRTPDTFIVASEVEDQEHKAKVQTFSLSC